jgi:TRAP-type mannitol/chloroaromatic compound transport system permease large subunit
MMVIFILGFPLDFVEIVIIVVPITGPVLMQMGIDPIWLGVLIAMNLQTSFLTPPLGPTLFYIQSVLPEGVTSRDVYRGITPFVIIQVLALLLVVLFPATATWLPSVMG